MKNCVLCDVEIPKKNNDELIDLGYNGVVDNFTHKSHIFCPLHSSKDIADYVLENKIGM